MCFALGLVFVCCYLLIFTSMHTLHIPPGFIAYECPSRLCHVVELPVIVRFAQTFVGFNIFLKGILYRLSQGCVCMISSFPLYMYPDPFLNSTRNPLVSSRLIDRRLHFNCAAHSVSVSWIDLPL